MSRYYFTLVCLFVIAGLSTAQESTDGKHQDGNNRSVSARFRSIVDFDELMSTIRQTGTPGYAVMFCGDQRNKTSVCKDIKSLFQQAGNDFPKLEQELLYYDLNEGDLEVLSWFEISTNPCVIFVKDGRYFYYRMRDYSNNLLALFVARHAADGSYVWRSLPTKRLTKWDRMLEGLWRTHDRLYVLMGGYSWAMNAMYFFICCLVAIFLVGIFYMGVEAFTGRVYRNIGDDGKLAPVDSESLKVKRE